MKRPGVNYDNIDLCTDGWYDEEYPEKPKWRPSIHMPKAACRLFLKIIDVRVERLKDISEEDARAEGVEFRLGIKSESSYKNYINNGYGDIGADGSFKTLWQSINGPESWVANPWVWVIEFERIEKPDIFLK